MIPPQAHGMKVYYEPRIVEALLAELHWLQVHLDEMADHMAKTAHITLAKYKELLANGEKEAEENDLNPAGTVVLLGGVDEVDEELSERIGTVSASYQRVLSTIGKVEALFEIPITFRAETTPTPLTRPRPESQD